MWINKTSGDILIPINFHQFTSGLMGIKDGLLWLTRSEKSIASSTKSSLHYSWGDTEQMAKILMCVVRQFFYYGGQWKITFS